MKKGNKKGVSPLIATVIVIGAVILISSLLFIFMKDTLIKNIAKAGASNEGGQKCMAVDIKLTDCEIDGQRVIAKAENKGSESVVQWIIRATDGAKTEAINQAGEVGAKKTRKIGGRFRKLDKESIEPEIEFVPVVSAKGFGFSCNDRIVKVRCS